MEHKNQYGIQDRELFKNDADYWQVADVVRNIYMSDGSLATLMDFERVLDELDIYAFRNWAVGELVEGPDIKKYWITVTFMWPQSLMPDPRGARRLLPFDCKVQYQKDTIKVPMKIDDPSDYRPGTKKAKIIEKPIWLVTITMPKSLIQDVKTGSVEMEDQEIDLKDLDDAYDKDLDDQANQNNQQAQNAQQQLQTPA